MVYSIGGRTSRAARYYAEPSRLGLDEIDRHYGHLAHDSRDHAINLLDAFTDSEGVDVHGVDTAWTPQSPAVAHPENATAQ